MDNHSTHQDNLDQQRCMMLELELSQVKHDLKEARNEKARVSKELSDLKKDYDLLNHMSLTITSIGGVSLFLHYFFVTTLLIMILSLRLPIL